MFATSYKFFPGDHQPGTGSTTIILRQLPPIFVILLYMPILRDTGSRNTLKVACGLIGLSQVVTRFEVTILILREHFGTCVDFNFCLKVAIHDSSPLLRLEFMPTL